MTFDPINVLHCGQGLFRPNLVVTGHSWANWPLVDLCMNLDPWPHKCITLWSRVLMTEFGSLRTFLDKLTSGWPMPDLWPTNVLHFGQGFLWLNLTYIYFACWVIAFLHINQLACILLDKLTSGWPLHDLWSHKCITLWSRVLFDQIWLTLLWLLIFLFCILISSFAYLKLDPWAPYSVTLLVLLLPTTFGQTLST